MIDYSKIADFIIKTVQNESVCGFQYVIYNMDIEYEFGITINDDKAREIGSELVKRKEVADFDYVNETFDVVLYTNYAPNYID